MRKRARTKLKGVKKLEHKVTRLLKPFGVHKCLLGTEFTVLPADAVVTFPIVLTEEVDKDFVAYCNSIEETTASAAILSFLHEVGHIKTCYDFEIYEWEEYEFIVEELTLKMSYLSVDKRKQYLNDYFKLPQESAASTWAVKYANAHPENVTRLCIKLDEVFNEFYKKNNITL